MKKLSFSSDRRVFLKKMALSASALTLSPFVPACASPASVPIFSDAEIDVELQLSSVRDNAQILSGASTNVWRYQGELLKGPEDTLEIIPDSYLGPIIHLENGQHVRINFANKLDEPSIIHWHGLHVPESADGHPRLAIAPGEQYTYDFTVLDRAGTYWYHPHPHGRTGPQVYYGLAGLIMIHDPEEELLNLPRGQYDLPIVIQDRTFDQDNQLVYGGSNMDQMMGFLGTSLLINGQKQNDISVKARSYRLRLLNGSNSRIYKLAMSDDSPLVVIGTDGGLLEYPVERNAVTIAPAQRIELWMDFSKYPVGEKVQLINQPNSTPGGNNPFTVATFSIDQEASGTTALPPRLSIIPPHDSKEAVNANRPRQFSLQMGMGMIWNINGRTFEMEQVASDEKVRLGDLEIWQFTNLGGMGMGMLLPHPMHIHGLQFQIIERQIDPRYQDVYASVSDGLVDEGWHDTVLVMPGEQVKVLMRFEDFAGLYLYHCHNLEHEDMGMMRNFSVS